MLQRLLTQLITFEELNGNGRNAFGQDKGVLYTILVQTPAFAGLAAGIFLKAPYKRNRDDKAYPTPQDPMHPAQFRAPCQMHYQIR